jgi:hypothetical protein
MHTGAPGAPIQPNGIRTFPAAPYNLEKALFFQAFPGKGAGESPHPFRPLARLALNARFGRWRGKRVKAAGGMEPMR